ncbi:SGNH/GDSL hydrolase family protein [Cryptosporangium sp. NPDC048952]|uniref:SGNH/GDSL hydrolase family protein n=1 Tax=Cryptosporangium sp. NPDC048952 TaxID=3363961 RepID=UPI00371E3C5A
MRFLDVRHYVAMLLALVSVVVVAVVLFDGHSAPPPYSTPDTAREPLSAEPRARPTVLFIGDSYTAGHIGVKGSQTFARLAADQMGWICNIDAEGGTGYLADGRENSTDFAPYIKRLARTRSQYLADYIVVSGGRNDLEVAGFESNFATAASRYLRALHEAFPDAKMFLLAPFWQNDNPPEALRQERAVIEAIAANVGATFINTSTWLNPKMISGDGIHPSLGGHRELADEMVSALRSRGLEPFESGPLAAAHS